MDIKRVAKRIVKWIVVIVLLLIGALVLSSMAYLLSRPIAEMTFYEHGPSKQFFYDSLDFSADDLSPFKSEDVLFVVELRQKDQENYIVWLALYTQSPDKSVVVREAKISGNGWQLEEAINLESILDTEVESSNLMKASVRLFDVRGELLQKALNDGGNLTLDVSYSINNVPGTISFKLVRRVERYRVYPT